MVAETSHADNRLAEVVRRLVGAYAPERIFLFGSVARGDAGPNSDYDLMMLIEKADKSLHRISQQAHSLLWDLGVAADILVWTREAFDSRLHLKASLPSTILREGKLLYAA